MPWNLGTLLYIQGDMFQRPVHRPWNLGTLLYLQGDMFQRPVHAMEPWYLALHTR